MLKLHIQCNKNILIIWFALFQVRKTNICVAYKRFNSKHFLVSSTLISLFVCNKIIWPLGDSLLQLYFPFYERHKKNLKEILVFFKCTHLIYESRALASVEIWIVELPNSFDHFPNGKIHSAATANDYSSLRSDMRRQRVREGERPSASAT